MMSYGLRKKVFEKANGFCWYCGCALTIDNQAGRHNHKIPQSNFVIDHFISKKKGGGEEIGNLVPSCNWCNCQKKDRDLEDFREHFTRLAGNIPKFTDEQLYYLKINELNLPIAEPYVFYFEREGLTS